MLFQRVAPIIIVALCGVMLVACGARGVGETGVSVVKSYAEKEAEAEATLRDNQKRLRDWCAENQKQAPLPCAIAYGDAEKVNRLIADGSEFNGAYNELGWTYLYLAAYMGESDSVDALIKAGANVNVLVGEEGHTPLLVAMLVENNEAIMSLINAGADVNAIHKGIGVTPIHFWAASPSGSVEVMNALINAGADINFTGRDGSTPLHTAAKHGRTFAVDALIRAGAYVGAVNNDRATPLDVARWNKRWSVVKILENPPLPNSRLQTSQAPKQGKGVPNVATAPAPDDSTVAEHVYENAWRSVVYVHTNDGQGSGVVIRPNIVATNCHVVDGGGIVVYKAEDGRTDKETRYRATIRRADNKNDFCLLDVKGLWGIPANVRRYDTLRVGESVYGLGAPQGLDLSMSTGIISQKRAAKGVRYIQTDVAISPGSSGGGLFDREGNLVGIMTAKIVGEDVEGIGFAIPADLALE